MWGRETVVIYLKGLCMGAADAVPGVSGGTIALIVGIYERLVSAIAAIDREVLPALVQPWDPASRAEIRSTVVEMDLPFLLPLGAGVISAIILATRGIDYLLANAQAATYAFFFGLIGAAAIVLYNEVSLDTTRHRAVGMTGFLLAFLVSGLPPSALPSTLPVVFGAGLLAVSAMVLPGVSGSLILLVLGQYEYMVDVLRRFVDGLIAAVTGGAAEEAIGAAPAVLTFVLGAGIGLLSIAKLIKWALERYRAATLTFLVALMLGALRKPIDEIRAAELAWTSTEIGIVLGAGLGGAIAVFALAVVTDGLSYRQDEEPA
jgi:putative membrane protein